MRKFQKILTEIRTVRDIPLDTPGFPGYYWKNPPESGLEESALEQEEQHHGVYRIPQERTF